MDKASASACEIAKAVRAGEVDAVDVISAAIDRIDRRDRALGAFVEVFNDHALARARELDARRQAERPMGELAGVPLAVKDNICFEQGKTTCGSRMLAGYRSPYTATALARLIDAGAIVVGKTNLDEFAMGSSTEHSTFGPTRNPYDLQRVPGGSSGGSAAAVGARMVPVALGSDTGGSIRQPASLCGVVGLKPTYGRVSRYGLVAHASSLDQIGPMGRCVADVALMLKVMAGHDPLDSTSSTRSVDHMAMPSGRDGGDDHAAQPSALKVVGVPTRWGKASRSDDLAWSALERVAVALEAQGVQVREIELPHAAHAAAAYYILSTAEASSNLARYDGVRYGHRAAVAPDETLETMYTNTRAEGFGPEVQRRIMLGTFVLSSGYYDAYYHRALKVRRLIAQDYDLAFDQGCDAIIMPASVGPAFAIGEKSTDPMELYLEDIYTVGVNLAGLPAISLPVGTGEVEGTQLPVGMQLIGRAWCERELLLAAKVVEDVVAAHRWLEGLSLAV